MLCFYSCWCTFVDPSKKCGQEILRCKGSHASNCLLCFWFRRNTIYTLKQTPSSGQSERSCKGLTRPNSQLKRTEYEARITEFVLGVVKNY